MKSKLVLTVLVLLLVAASTASAGIILPAFNPAEGYNETPFGPAQGFLPALFATGEDLVLEFVSGQAMFDNWLGLAQPSWAFPVFKNHATLPGTVVNLGAFAPGQPVNFSVLVNSVSWYMTGQDPLRFVYRNLGSAGILVGFEDWLVLGQADFDYNDTIFIVRSGVAPIPEPATLVLATAGLLAAIILRKILT